MARAESPPGDSHLARPRRSRAERTAARRRALASCDKGLAAACARIRELEGQLDQARHVARDRMEAEAAAASAAAALRPSDELRDALTGRLVQLGQALLLHHRADAALGMHHHRLGDALRAVAQSLDLGPEFLKLGMLVKGDGDRARHEPLLPRPLDVPKAAVDIQIEVCVAEPPSRILLAQCAGQAAAAQLRRGAAPFWPLRPPGRWAAGGGDVCDLAFAADAWPGLVCTCGAVVFSSCDLLSVSGPPCQEAPAESPLASGTACAATPLPGLERQGAPASCPAVLLGNGFTDSVSDGEGSNGGDVRDLGADAATACSLSLPGAASAPSAAVLDFLDRYDGALLRGGGSGGSAAPAAGVGEAYSLFLDPVDLGTMEAVAWGPYAAVGALLDLAEARAGLPPLRQTISVDE
ncbi:unnamed protein product [Prorocentrum cordatum]|uniref:Uncharacterized protein n=1 Tax=Prorocentrum cordatum TaxID=2364126 RepID=A0ABN9QUL0_9DINO|nr:unnamed protein product [Polarella glacialis]